MEKSTTVVPFDRSFLSEMCEFSGDFNVTHKTLYDEYKKWCKTNNFFVSISSKKFSQSLNHKQYILKKRYTGGIVWVGIRLKVGPKDELKDIMDKRKMQSIREAEEFKI